MTDLAVPGWMNPKREQAVERWHGIAMRGDLIASVVLSCAGDGTWSARTQLRDRSLRPIGTGATSPIGTGATSGSFATEEAALRAGRAAAWRLHKATVGMREVPEQVVAFPPPAGGYQSQALRRFAQAQRMARAVPAQKNAPEMVSELIA